MEPKLKYATIQWWPKFGCFTTIAFINSSCTNSTMSANFITFVVSDIIYRPTEYLSIKIIFNTFLVLKIPSVQWWLNFHQFTATRYLIFEIDSYR